MTNKIDVLAIDDDKFVQKMIIKALSSDDLVVRTANDGESGIQEATEKTPDIILLDVEMPGMNGYEVCEQFRNNELTKDVPVVFLSSHSSLRERLQGYEVGADDYLIKPFEAEHLLARINVLISLYQERKEFKQKFELAQKTAIMAMTGSGELGQAMQYLEQSLSYHNVDDLINGLFETTNQFSLNCCIMIVDDGKYSWFSSEGIISPLEKELLEMCDRSVRFLDFGARTIINYPLASLLIKNMPLDDMERYGRMKDLLPILISSINTKINTLKTQESLTEQSVNLLESFKMIKRNLYHLGTTIVKNRKDSRTIMSSLVEDLNYDLLRMGLEEDQEEFLLNRIDSAIEEAMIQIDAGKEIRDVLTFILNNLRNVMDKQETLFNAFTASLATESSDHDDALDDGVELF